MKGNDIFDILGVSSREDTYTDLVANAFNQQEHGLFRKKVIKFFCGEDLSDNNAFIDIRMCFNLQDKSIGKRGKLLPDMLLCLPLEKKLILIENKIFSQEGYYQTADYSSTEAIEVMKSHYKEVSTIDFYYMTLQGDRPVCDDFIPVTWSDFLLSTVPDSEFIKPFNILMSDLLSRAKHLLSFEELELSSTSLTLDDILKEYIGEGISGKWINKKTVFRKWMHAINREIQFDYPDIQPLVTMANGNSPQYLSVYFNNDWKMVNLFDKESLDVEREHTQNIHIEFNWNTSNRAVLLIHYEPNPYISEKEFRSKFPEVYEPYRENREAYKNVLHEVMDGVELKGFVKANSKLTMAKYEFKNVLNIPYEEFEQSYYKAFVLAYDLICSANKIK